MNKFLLTLIVAASILTGQQRYWKGQLHTHSSASAGSTYDPTTLAQIYRTAGYNFLCITDHNTVTTSHDTTANDTFLIIISDEYSNISAQTGFHNLAINVTTDNVLTNPQESIDSIVVQGGIAVLAHPNWTSRFRLNFHTGTAIKNYTNASLMEIYNSFCYTHYCYKEGIAFDIWDDVLSNSNKRIYGVAVDDGHNANQQDKAWVMVKSSVLSVDSIKVNMLSGNFYASNGAVIDSVSITNKTLTVYSSSAVKIDFITRNGTITATVNDTVGSHAVTGPERYVRAVVTNSSGKWAWTQPLFY